MYVLSTYVQRINIIKVTHKATMENAQPTLLMMSKANVNVPGLGCLPL